MTFFAKVDARIARTRSRKLSAVRVTVRKCFGWYGPARTSEIDAGASAGTTVQDFGQMTRAIQGQAGLRFTLLKNNRYSLRRALSLDSVGGGTHNPTIARGILLAETNTPPFGSP